MSAIDKVVSPKRMKLVPGRVSSSLSSSEDVMDTLATEMKERASGNQVFTDEEISVVLKSVQNVENSVNVEELKKLLKDVAHYTHKEWDKTLDSAQALRKVLLGDSTKMTSSFQTLMERVLKEGNWDGAKAAAEATTSKPWVVLVTGVNGIRKTTSMYQPWFSELLSEALIAPDSTQEIGPLPTGSNSFFRQLDHMIAILVNEEFQNLYSLTAEAVDDKSSDVVPNNNIIDKYARLKDAIFTRYRTLAEMMGILLIQLAQDDNLNVMVETSGRDVAMFHYIERFFPNYNKLALHFVINDISYAETSVDNRMIHEIQTGMDAIGDVHKVIYANAGGPYGSSVLQGVQRDSDKVWDDILHNRNDIGPDWFKATIQIHGNPDQWTASAVKQDGTQGKVFSFTR